MAQDIKIGLIGGSGLGAALGARTNGTRHEIDTPFGRPSDAIVETEWAGLPVFFLSRHGAGHTLNPTQVPYRANICALKQLGVTHILSSGAVGSLREEFKPRDLVVPDQIIDKTSKRPGTFYEKAAVHVEFAEPFCPVLRRILLEAAGQQQNPSSSAHRVHERGCYVCMEGPAFSTRAESLMHRLWGGDLIGMTAMPEAKLAREAEISCALIALVTDYDCWKQHPAATPPPTGSADQGAPVDAFALLKEIIGNLEAASNNTIELIQRAVALIAQRPHEVLASPALHSLKLAIWSDKSTLDPTEVERLKPLWGRYFEQSAVPTAAEAPSERSEPPPAPETASSDAAENTGETH